MLTLLFGSVWIDIDNGSFHPICFIAVPAHLVLDSPPFGTGRFLESS